MLLQAESPRRISLSWGSNSHQLPNQMLGRLKCKEQMMLLLLLLLLQHSQPLSSSSPRKWRNKLAQASQPSSRLCRRNNLLNSLLRATQ